jgi:glycosyltransferase involved in cell wall biosynthesis
MNILYVSQYFYPEMGAAAARVYELSRYWADMGHSVSVLTSFPNYPDGVLHPNYKAKMKKLILREQLNGINVIRTIGFPTHLRSSFRRSLSYTSFFLFSVISSNFLNGFDVVIGTSPSLFTGLAGLIIARMKKAPFVFEVRDLWPEVIPAVGKGDKNSITYTTFDKMASFLYEKSNLIVTVTESFRNEMITGRGIEPEKIKIVENAVDTDYFKPFKAEPALTGMPGLKNKFIVSYIGTIGYTHGVEVVLKAAREAALRFPNLAFLLIGGGSDKERLERISKEEKLENVVFLEQQPREMIPGYINSSDISLVLSSKEPLFQKTIFAKVFEPMACGKPVIVGTSGETRNLVVEKADAGIGFEPESAGGLIDSIAKLYNDPKLRDKLGENGRAYVTREFTRSLKAKQYSDILSELTRK